MLSGSPAPLLQATNPPALITNWPVNMSSRSLVLSSYRMLLRAAGNACSSSPGGALQLRMPLVQQWGWFEYGRTGEGASTRPLPALVALQSRC